MKNYRSKSWSHQARYKADLAYWYYWNANNNGLDSKDTEWIAEMADKNTHVYGFAYSYRPPIIRYRAAKRFRRLVRVGKPAKEPKF